MGQDNFFSNTGRKHEESDVICSLEAETLWTLYTETVNHKS